MQAITILPEIREKCPALQLGIIQAKVKTAPASPALLAKIQKKVTELQATLEIDRISKLPAIHHTREAYKALGKKPGRYRPSAEALLRRVVSEKGLYRINNLVDLLNYVSISTGFSIGGYDADKIQGPIRLSVGVENEPYDAIARGQLNIGGLPCLRDDPGAFGSPTSDSTRTMVSEDTTRFLMVIFDFNPTGPLAEAIDLAKEMLINFAEAEAVENMIHPGSSN